MGLIPIRVAVFGDYKILRDYKIISGFPRLCAWQLAHVFSFKDTEYEFLNTYVYTMMAKALDILQGYENTKIVFFGTSTWKTQGMITTTKDQSYWK